MPLGSFLHEYGSVRTQTVSCSRRISADRVVEPSQARGDLGRPHSRPPRESSCPDRAIREGKRRIVFILLDTDIIQRMATYGEFLYDGSMPEDRIARTVRRHGSHEMHEMSALREILFVLRRGSLPVVVSDWSIRELSQTGNPSKREPLVAWAHELRDWWLANDSFAKLTPRKAAGRIERHLNSGKLDFLQNQGDRRLFAEAIPGPCPPSRYTPCCENTPTGTLG